MAHLGEYLIFAAAGCSAFSLVLYFLVWRGKEEHRYKARLFYKFGAAFITTAIVTLLYLILIHDFTVSYVYSYSSSDLPLGYLIASLWGGQQGTFLLWLFFTAALGLIMMYTAKHFEAGNMFFLNLFNLSLLSMLLKKSPFEIMPVFQPEGAGLNPLLQNFWMQIHPPIMFIGFAAIAFPFCFAMTALVNRKYDIWAESARKWTLFAWVSLGTALVMGGYWAYETLGWGGFWAWDPVENSSFIPWIFLTAQVHSLFIKRHRRGLLRFSLFVVCLSFWSVLYGTFLTRSGVLADFSVHSFVDLGINSFLVGGLAVFVVIGSFLLIWRWQDIKAEAAYSTVNSRSYLVTIGIVMLFLGGFLTLLGTSAPLLTRFTDNPSNVGLKYYFTTMTPVAVAVLFLLALFPSFRWKQGIVRPKLLMIGAASGLLVVILLVVSSFTSEVIYLLLFGAATWTVVTNSYVVIHNLQNKRFLPGYLAHVGLAVALVGAAVSAGFDTTKTINLPQGETVTAMGYEMKFTKMVETPKGFDCHVEFASGDEEFTAVLPHEFPPNSEGVMRKPHVVNYLGHDLYVAPVAMENTEQKDPGHIKMAKGDVHELDKYRISFKDFEFDREMDDMPRMVAAVLNIEYDGRNEQVKPRLDLTGKDVKPSVETFDYGRGSISIVGVLPDEGAVILYAAGEFITAAEQSPPILVIELSTKPLIILFWVGTLIAFLAGALAMIERRRKARATRAAQQEIVAEKTKEAAVQAHNP